MLTIILDASTSISTAILASGDQVIAKRSSEGKALAQLHLCIRDVLQEAFLHISDIERIAVVQGPGSWTGLHVAISSAKTLAQVYNLPLVPISFIDALAISCQEPGKFLTAISSFTKGNIFYRNYEVINDKIVPTSEHRKSPISVLLETLKEIDRPIKLVGDFSHETSTEIENAGIVDIVLEHISYPSEIAMARMVNEATCEGKSFQDMIFLEPLYMQLAGEGPRLFSNKIIGI